MQKHIKVYISFFNPHDTNWIPCEICGNKAVDIHHIHRRSEFGKKCKDEQDKIENLIALCRKCHELAHSNVFTKEYLKAVHDKKIKFTLNTK